MFKKGQLVQSVKYGDYYVIETSGPTMNSCVPLSPKFWFGRTMFLEHERLRLIGNNYQAKQKCSR